MAYTQPFSRLTGTLQVYLGPVGETVPAVDTTPAGNWALLGPTDGEQSIQNMGANTYFRDNDHQGPVKGVRPEEDVLVKFNLVGLTLENYAKILDAASDVTTAAGPPATKKMPLKRGANPTEYAMLLRGPALSPYGLLPGMYVIPRCVVDGEPTATFAKDGSPALECEFYALEDDAQAEADKMGWLIVQTA